MVPTGSTRSTPVPDAPPVPAGFGMRVSPADAITAGLLYSPGARFSCWKTDCRFTLTPPAPEVPPVTVATILALIGVPVV